jgi:glycerate-2-kinase
MADTFARIAGDRIRDGIVIGTHLPIKLPPMLEWIPSSHPLPDERSVAAGRRALEAARQSDPGEVLVVLLSGGASALMAVPAGDLTLEDKRTAVNALAQGRRRHYRAQHDPQSTSRRSRAGAWRRPRRLRRCASRFRTSSVTT